MGWLFLFLKGREIMKIIYDGSLSCLGESEFLFKTIELNSKEDVLRLWFSTYWIPALKRRDF